MRAEWRPAPEDELLHQPTGDSSVPWKDTFYFSLVDAQADVHLAMHMTVTHGRPAGTRIAVGMRAGGGETVAVRTEAGTHSKASLGNSLARLEVGNLSWDGEHRLRWVAEAPEFAFDVDVTGVHFAPLFDTMFPGANPSGKLGYSYSHTEQVIRGEGTVLGLDGRERPISAFGWRDRGWGRRINELAFGSGYDLVAGILPNGSAFAFTAMRNVEHGPDAPVPAYGFLTDGDGAVPAVAGTYFKDSMCYPTHLGLEFADGRRIDAVPAGRISTLSVPFHDAQPEAFGIAVNARDYYAMLTDAGGEDFPVFSNEGHALLADVTGGARFFYDGSAPV